MSYSNTNYEQRKQIKMRLSWFNDYQKLQNVFKVCRRHGISPKTFYKWLKRYKTSGNDPNALVNHSRKPRNKHPNSTAPQTVELILKLKAQTNFGQKRLRSLLAAKYNIKLAEKTIYKYLKAFNMSSAYKSKRPKHKRRYSMPYPGDIVQIDIKFVKINRKQLYQFSAIDDCTRSSIVKFYTERSNMTALDFADFVIRTFPFKIKTIQTDNDSVFTINHPRAVDKQHHFSQLLLKRGIRHKLIKPYSPELNGKVERFHRSCEEEFFRVNNFKSFEDLVSKSKEFMYYYNHLRSHSGINNLTPIEKLRSFPKYKNLNYVTTFS
jgi:transposase InsO family protein